MNISVYTDGGASGNPGPAASAFVIYDESGNEVACSSKPIGNTTNNTAEYTALINALTYIQSVLTSTNTVASISVFSDSELMVRQLTGVYKIKNEDIRRLATKVKGLSEGIVAPITYHHIPREKNKRADSLVRAILYP